jgi:hypothetical protein
MIAEVFSGTDALNTDRTSSKRRHQEKSSKKSIFYKTMKEVVVMLAPALVL